MRSFFVLCAVASMALFALFGERALHHAAHGLELFACSALPALFPFFVCICTLRRLGALSPNGGKTGFFALLRTFFIAAIAGSPSGSLLVDELFDENTELGMAERSTLAALMNSASPVFILGAAGPRFAPLTFPRTSLPAAALLIAASHYCAGLLSVCIYYFAVIARKTKRISIRSVPHPSAPPRSAQPFVAAFPAAVFDAVQAMLKLGGALVFFVALSGTLFELPLLGALHPAVRALLGGLLEMTGGVFSLAVRSGASMRLILSLASFLITFGGVCIYMQANAVKGCGAADYLLAKLLEGAAAFSIAYLAYPLFFDDSAAVFSSSSLRLAANRLVTLGELSLLFLLASGASVLFAVIYTKRTRA